MSEDNTTKTININIKNNFLVFIWFIGYMFTAGYINPETKNIWEQLLSIFVLAIGWPLALGAKLGGHLIF